MLPKASEPTSIVARKGPLRRRNALLATAAGLGTASCNYDGESYAVGAGLSLLILAAAGGAFYAGLRLGRKRGRAKTPESTLSIGEYINIGEQNAVWNLFSDCSSRQSALGVFVAIIESGEHDLIEKAMNHAREKWKNPRLNADIFMALALRLQDLYAPTPAYQKRVERLIDVARGFELDVDHITTGFRHLLEEKDWTGAVNVLGVANPDLCVLLAKELYLFREAPSNLLSVAALATVGDVGSFATAIRILRSQRNYSSIERLLRYAGETMSRHTVKKLLSSLCDQTRFSVSDEQNDMFAVLGLKPTLMLEPRILKEAYTGALGIAATIVSSSAREERVEMIGRAYEVLSNVDSCAQHFATVGTDAVMRGDD